MWKLRDSRPRALLYVCHVCHAFYLSVCVFQPSSLWCHITPNPAQIPFAWQVSLKQQMEPNAKRQMDFLGH